MPSRRISSLPGLAPVQEIAVNPYSSYNSDNVNMLTRAVTGAKNKDIVEKQDFLDAVDRIIGGLEKKNKLITQSEKKTIAFNSLHCKINTNKNLFNAITWRRECSIKFGAFRL